MSLILIIFKQLICPGDIKREKIEFLKKPVSKKEMIDFLKNKLEN